MPLTVFGTIVFCAAITLMLLSAVSYIQDKRFVFLDGMKYIQKPLRPCVIGLVPLYGLASILLA